MKKLYDFMLFKKRAADKSALYYVELKLRFLMCLCDTAFIGFISYMFYHSMLPAIILLPSIIIIYDKQYHWLINKRISKLSLEFKDSLWSISTGLSSGYSLENATKFAYGELCNIYGKESYMARELYMVLNQLQLGEKIEDCFLSLAKRCPLEPIVTFSDILNISKRTSGNITTVVRSSATTIISRMDTDRELKLAIASKLFERNIMLVMPFVMIIFLNVSSPGYMDSLYVTIGGHIVMTICLALYITAYLLTEKIFSFGQ